MRVRVRTCRLLNISFSEAQCAHHSMPADSHRCFIAKQLKPCECQGSRRTGRGASSQGPAKAGRGFPGGGGGGKHKAFPCHYLVFRAVVVLRDTLVGAPVAMVCVGCAAIAVCDQITLFMVGSLERKKEKLHEKTDRAQTVSWRQGKGALLAPRSHCSPSKVA